MEKQVYSADLKSAALKQHPGSTPGTRTIIFSQFELLLLK